MCLENDCLSTYVIQPPAKTAARVSTFTRNKKSNETKRQSKLSMVSTTTTKNDQSAKSSVRENLTEESIQGQVSSEGDCKPSTSAAVTKKVSRRRKSYTSSLMEGHKVEKIVFLCSWIIEKLSVFVVTCDRNLSKLFPFFLLSK